MSALPLDFSWNHICIEFLKIPTSILILSLVLLVNILDIHKCKIGKCTKQSILPCPLFKPKMVLQGWIQLWKPPTVLVKRAYLVVCRRGKFQHFSVSDFNGRGMEKARKLKGNHGYERAMEGPWYSLHHPLTTLGLHAFWRRLKKVQFSHGYLTNQKATHVCRGTTGGSSRKLKSR